MSDAAPPPFAPFVERAADRHGGREALEARLPTPLDAAALRAVPDDRYLSLMSLRIFRAGLRHALVDAKWPAFEEVFHGFEPRRITAMSDEDLERLMADRRLIRHWGKIRSVRDNAAALAEVSEAHGGFGAWLADWPVENVVGLWAELAARFRQLGGNSGPYFLRMAGKDTFLLTGDVVAALTAAGIVDRKPTAKRDLRRVQEAFNAWAAETGRPLAQLSMILALSTG